MDYQNSSLLTTTLRMSTTTLQRRNTDKKRVTIALNGWLIIVSTIM